MYKIVFSTSVAMLLFSNVAMAACSIPNTLTNGTTADATQVMGNFTSLAGCAAPLASPSFTGNVTVTASSGIGMEVDTSGHAQIQAKATSSGGAYLRLDRYGSAYNTAVNFYTSGTNDFQVGVDVGVAGVFAFYDNSTSSIPLAIVQSNGYVGVGTSSPSYPLYVNGTAYATGAAGALSDIRHKKDVATLEEGAVDKVMHLRPVSFFWKDPSDDGMKGRQMGFIAQEVEQVLPTAVLTESNAEKTKGLKYNEITAVLTKALQEQQAEIAVLKAANDNRTAEIEHLQRRVSSLEGGKFEKAASR